MNPDPIDPIVFRLIAKTLYRYIDVFHADGPSRAFDVDRLEPDVRFVVAELSHAGYELRKANEATVVGDGIRLNVADPITVLLKEIHERGWYADVRLVTESATHAKPFASASVGARIVAPITGKRHYQSFRGLSGSPHDALATAFDAAKRWAEQFDRIAN